MDFLTSFKIITIGILQIFFIALCGFLCVRLKIISKEGVDTISKLVINLTLPFFIFVRIIKYFNFTQFSYWWIIPLISFGMLLLSYILASLFLPMFKIKDNIPEIKSLVTFQNSGYLPLALIQTLLFSNQQQAAFIYIFLFLLGFNFVIWSLGVRYLTKYKKSSNTTSYKNFFTAPFVAILISLLIVYLRLNRFIPLQVLKPIEWIGVCTIPLGILVIGAIIGEIKLNRKTINIKSIIYVTLLKLIIAPFVILLILKFVSLSYLLGLIIIIQASMPSATSLAIISRKYGSNYELISSGIFITHLLSLITIPLFIIFYYRLCG